MHISPEGSRRNELAESHLGRNDGMQMLEKPEEAIRPSDPTVPSSYSANTAGRHGVD
jgi:hypothetical protein